jgi:hypothetical protein
VFLPPGTIKKCFQDIINIIFATIVQSADDSQIAEAGQGRPSQELTAEQTAYRRFKAAAGFCSCKSRLFLIAFVAGSGRF